MKKDSSPIALPLQLSYLGLYAVGVVAALWMKGHPLLTIGILAAIIPLGLIARIPERYFDDMWRQIIQLIVAGGGLYWGMRRMSAATSLDLGLVEATTILSLALIVGGVRKEYELLVTISVILLGFGGLYAGRQIYFPAFITYVVLANLLLYQTRSMRLYGLENGIPENIPWLRQNWIYRIFHLALVFGAAIALVAVIPMPHGRIHTRGFFPVSFNTKQQLEFPELWDNWIKPAKTLISKDSDSTQTSEEGGEPTLLSKDSVRIVKAKSVEAFDARDGEGNGFGLGEDLVMRVRAPAKLYWLGKLYDRYTGKTWQASNMLLEAQSGLDTFRPRNEREVEQHISVTKNVSKQLCAAFRAKKIKYEGHGSGKTKDDGLGGGFSVNLQGHLRGASIGRGMPETPWTYLATSTTPVIDSDNPMAPWESNLRRGWNYRYIPRRLTSERMRKLAREITKDCIGPMSKASAIRDYLRNNYKYDLKVPKIPEDREVVDYFLFESKTGYCQHFSQAMTVLARLAGLPSRLATGFLPGNYEVLSNSFEVYEYHAHAWSQVFIEPWGWLTFDAAPPGELPTKKTHTFLSNLMDPFGDEWSSRPPEFSDPIDNTKEKSNEEKEANLNEEPKKQNAISKAADDVYRKAVLDSGTMEPTPLDLAKAAFGKLWEWAKNFWETAKKKVVDWSLDSWSKLKAKSMQFLKYLAALPWYFQAAWGITVFTILLLWFRRKRIARVVTAWRFRRQCRQIWQRLSTQRQEEHPNVIIELCHELSDRLLRMSGLRRPKTLDLVEYAGWLVEKEPEIGTELQVIAPSVIRHRFGNGTMRREDAELVFAATDRLRSGILSRIAKHGTPSVPDLG